MAQYNGMLLRQNLQDGGSIPRSGGWTASPDLIAGGTQPLADPQATLGSAASYGTDPTQPVMIAAPNYIYLRGKNLGTAAVNAEARAFAAPQALFLYPSQWLQNPLQTSQGNAVSTIASVAPNAIGVTTDPLVWTPPAGTDSHFCLVGFLSTPDFPYSSQQPPAAVSSLDALGAWIGATGGTGWHNVQFAASSATWTNTTTYPVSTTKNKVHLNITCVGVPQGAAVSFSCGTPLPGYGVINLPLTTVNSSSRNASSWNWRFRPAGRRRCRTATTPTARW